MAETNPDDLRRIDALLDEALALPPAERAAYLDRACAGAPHLRARIDALLAHEHAAEAFLETPAPERAAALLLDEADDEAGDEAASDRSGTHVGPYRLVHLLGRGGMGSVYLAERADGQFTQRVALKLIRRGLDTEDILSRFRYERQILASLDHPNVAHLLDGGSTDDGRPYFVLEYVEGAPLTEYCDRHRLSVAQRLALFRTVCRTVQYAHQNLVVHRDLKPSNILVTEAGTVKLLDFGIAKLLSEEGLEAGAAVPRTRTDVRVMTPEYAAPEQVRGEAVTTATDVYQLGVLLYELLTGQRPYRIARRVRREIERVILEEEPTRPSTALVRAETAATAGAARATTVERLRRRLSGDLDNIVLKALAKEAGRRYATVAELADDLQRHLAGRPVTARPDTLPYRVRKFVQRHKAGVAATVLVVLAVAAGLAGTTWQARVAAAERDRAQAEALKATRTAAFLVDLFEAAGPEQAQGREITARALLETGERQIATELADQPAVRTQLLGVMGDVYYTMGAYDRAEALLQEAVTLSADPAVSPSERALARYRLAVMHSAREDLAAADSLFAEVLFLLRQDEPDRSAGATDLALHVLREQAKIRHSQGRYDESEALFRQALERAETVMGPQSEAVALATTHLADLLEQLGRFDEAQSLYEQALAVNRHLHGPDHPDNLRAEIVLGHLHYTRQNYAAADSAYRVLLPRLRHVLGDDHPEVAWLLNYHAVALHDLGDPAAAEQVYAEAVAIYRRLGYDETHPALSAVLNNLAFLLVERKDYAGAAVAFEDIVRARRRRWPDGHDDVALALHNLGSVLHVKGDYARAEPYLREALAMYEATLGKDHHRAARTRLRYGQCLADLGRRAEAEPLMVRAYEVLRDTYGPETTEVQRAAGHVAAFYEAWGRPEAAAFYRRLSASE